MFQSISDHSKNRPDAYFLLSSVHSALLLKSHWYWIFNKLDKKMKTLINTLVFFPQKVCSFPSLCSNIRTWVSCSLWIAESFLYWLKMLTYESFLKLTPCVHSCTRWTLYRITSSECIYYSNTQWNESTGKQLLLWNGEYHSPPHTAHLT